ncbi:MAG: VCBS repeat-containing protein, partial [Planctomycetes bacterium]|nr:VCBS repeat-containing protein [Planctomycetota bacterium]
MDLDRDGRVDLLSGSYSPGDLYLFAGTAPGFAAPRVLQDAHGGALRVGRAAWPFACDWDRDGDLDLVLGNMYGKV